MKEKCKSKLDIQIPFNNLHNNHMVLHAPFSGGAPTMNRSSSMVGAVLGGGGKDNTGVRLQNAPTCLAARTVCKKVPERRFHDQWH